MIAHALFLALPFFSATKAATPPLQVFNREHEVVVSVATDVAGPYLRFTAEFPRPVKTYLKEEYDNLPLEFHIDIDNNANSGNEDSPDVRRGAEFIVMAVARYPRAKVKGEEVTVTRNAGNMMLKTAARVHIEGNTMTVTIPLSELKLKKGQKIRLAVVADGELTDTTLTL